MMSSSSTPRLVLIGLALGVLLALFAAPQTRWLVCTQLLPDRFVMASARYRFVMASAQELTLTQESTALDSQRYAAAHSNDFPLQFAAALQLTSRQSNNSLTTVYALRALQTQFGNQPSLYANLLRYETRSDTINSLRGRKENILLNGTIAPSPGAKQRPPLDPAELAAFDVESATGERLDPDNAYFPFVRAIGLFAAHRDQEGLDAVLRASTKSTWQEYIQDEVEGRIRLADGIYGGGNVLVHTAIYDSILLPHWSCLRSVARIATYKAMQAEQTGQTGRGMAIRRALMRCGDLMRVQSHSYIGSLVGAGIAAIATARPGGAPMYKPDVDKPNSGEELGQRRIQAFCDYARRAGYPEDAVRAQAQEHARQTIETIVQKAESRDFSDFVALYPLNLNWAADFLTLYNILWLLVLWGLTTLLRRLPSVQNSKPISRAGGWGIWCAALILIYNLTANYAGSGDSIFIFSFFTFIGGSLLMVLILVQQLRAIAWRTRWWPRIGRFALALIITLFSMYAITDFGVWLTHWAVSFWQGTTGFLYQTSSMNQSEEFENLVQNLAPLGGVLLSLAIPIVMVFVLSIVGYVRHVPISAVLVRGFQTASIPVACMLVIIYGGLVLTTLRQQQRLETDFRQRTQHEGWYAAALIGQPWPGPAP